MVMSLMIIIVFFFSIRIIMHYKGQLRSDVADQKQKKVTNVEELEVGDNGLRLLLNPVIF